MSDADATMAHEIAEAPEAVSRQAQGLARAVGGACGAPQAPAAAGRRHLCARQLGACGDLRQAPDRALSRHPGRRGRAEHRQRLRQAAAPRGPAVSRHLAVGQQRRSRRAGLERQGGGRAHRGDRQCHRRPAGPACDIVLPIGAGPELSVAATKTFIATLAALLRLIAAWTDDAGLRRRHRAAAGTAAPPPRSIGASW